MKKLGYLFISLMLIATASCSSGGSSQGSEAQNASEQAATPMTREEMISNIAAANAQCPINLGMGNNVVMQGMNLTDSTVVYIYTVARIANDLQPMKSAMLKMIVAEANMSASNKRFMLAVAQSGLSLVYEYTDDKGDSVELEIPNKELREALK